MLGPILSAVAQSVGPVVVQIFQQVGPIVGPLLTPNIRGMMAARLSEGLQKWYSSLSYDEKTRLNNAIIWVVKDLAADGAASITGLPVQAIVKKVLDEAQVHWTPEAAEYIESRLEQDISNSPMM